MENQKTNEQNVTIDPFSGEEFIKTRSNQKFASSANRLAYNGQKTTARRKAMARISKPLNNNRKVLEKVLGSETEVIRSYDFLMGAGLELGIFTHQIKHEQLIWSCVFDYGYVRLEGNSFRIRKFD